MPRSGSTLLQNILGNNPQFYTSPTSGLYDLLNASRFSFTKSAIIKAQDENVMKTAFLSYCRFALQGFYEGITDAPYVVDKSRAWMVNYAFLDSFYPNPKMIVVVRDLRDIVASMEKNYRKYPEKWDETVNEENPNGITVEQRVHNWLLPKNKPVGDTLTRLKESAKRGFLKNYLIVKFEDLTQYPEENMRRVHKYLDIPYYPYDFNNIQQVTHEDDKWHGKYGDHKIKPIVQPVKSMAIELLGRKLCNQIYQKNAWYFNLLNYK